MKKIYPLSIAAITIVSGAFIFWSKRSRELPQPATPARSAILDTSKNSEPRNAPDSKPHVVREPAAQLPSASTSESLAKLFKEQLSTLPGDLRGHAEMQVFGEIAGLARARLMIDGVRVERSETSFVRDSKGAYTRAVSKIPAIAGREKDFPKELDLEAMQEKIRSQLERESTRIEALSAEGKLWVVNDVHRLEPRLEFRVDSVDPKSVHRKELWLLDPETGHIKARSGRGRP